MARQGGAVECQAVLARAEREPIVGPSALSAASMWPGNRFMAGDPMKVATNRLSGSS